MIPPEAEPAEDCIAGSLRGLGRFFDGASPAPSPCRVGMSAHESTMGLAPSGEGRRHEVLGILCGAATALLALSLVSYDARGGENWIGVVGEQIAAVVAVAFGIAAWVVPFELALLTIRLFQKRKSPVGIAHLASTLVLVLVGCAMVHLAMPGQEVLGGHLPGGMLGEVLGELLRSFRRGLWVGKAPLGP